MYLHKIRMEVDVYICRKLSLKTANMTHHIHNTQRPATNHKKISVLGLLLHN